MQKIDPKDLVLMDAFAVTHPLRVEVMYARDDNLLFGERIYRKDARLWLHKDFAACVLEAADSLRGSDLRLVLYDGLRTTTAQARMLETAVVKANPQWLEEPRLLSPPGKGAHPRGMAVDVNLETLDGGSLDMGAVVDYLSDDPSPQGNPAHREYDHGVDVAGRRARLDAAMRRGDVIGLSQEWWDYRFPPEIYGMYAPLSDEELSPEMRMCD